MNKTAAAQRKVWRVLRHWPSVNVPIVSAGVLIAGIVMLVAPSSSFNAVAYQQGPFQLAPQAYWGAGFVAAGLLALVFRHLLAIFPLVLMVTGWAISLVLTALTVDGVSPLAGLAWAILAACLLASLARRGTTPQSGP
jgi:hypothetical protein